MTPGTFEFFEMPALHGRVMQPGNYGRTRQVFVMRHKTWMTRFNGDLSLLDKTFVLNGTGRSLIGIMPPRFPRFAGADLWIPEKLRPEAKTGFADAPPKWFMLGRLKPGLSTQEAEADLAVIASRLGEELSANLPAALHRPGQNAARRRAEPL